MTSENSENVVIAPGFVEHKLEHFRQRFSWDCGVSCVLMVLRGAPRDHLLQHWDRVCREEGFGCSTWTIDLCYLLNRFFCITLEPGENKSKVIRYGVQHCMFTTMPGVNEEYRRHGYYRQILDLDRERVQRRFAAAASAGVRVRRGALSAAALRDHLLRGPALALIDAGLLACDLCKHNKLRSEFRRCFGGSYRGHYVVVVGYSERAGKLLYRDPALPARLCACSPRALNAARAAPGTDHDLILVYNEPE